MKVIVLPSQIEIYLQNRTARFISYAHYGTAPMSGRTFFDLRNLGLYNTLDVNPPSLALFEKEVNET